MKNYERPVMIRTEELAEGVYLASGGIKCDSVYMNGVWQAPDYSDWNGTTRGYKQQFGCLGCPANTASGCNYDGQPDKTPWYAEKCIQLHTPTYVLLNFSEGKISIKALRSDTNEIFDSYELTKSAPSKTEYKDSLLQKIYLFFANRIFELRDIIF